MSTIWYLAEDHNVNKWFAYIIHRFHSFITDSLIIVLGSGSDPAKEIFDEAITLFGAALSKDSSKAPWLCKSKATNLKDVLDCVTNAQVEYENRKQKSRLRESLSKLAERVHHYGSIMDVLVQHHPEYVSLAWGAMKLLFVGVVNHERSLATLSSALCDIADKLPRVDLATRLYPTQRMKHAVAVLYADILMFLIRAHAWYQESKLSHALHSITRPSELRYADLLKNISYHSHNVTDLAMAGSQVEQRDMHIEQKEMNAKLDNLTALVSHLRETVLEKQIVNSNAHIGLCQSLSDIQLSQVLRFLSTPALADPQRGFQSSLFMRNKRRLRMRSGTEAAFWLDLRIRRWTASTQSSLILIKGTRRSRFCIQDFCTNVIELLWNANVPTLWILRTIDQNEGSISCQPSAVDLLKSLVLQALKLNCTFHKDYVISSRLQMYMSATTETQWFTLLASVLQGLPVVYLVIDIETLGSSLAETETNFSWPAAFLNLFQELSARVIKTLVKVVLVSYGSPVFARNTEKRTRDLVVQVGGLVKGSIALRGKARSKISGAALPRMSGRRGMSLVKPPAFAVGSNVHMPIRDGTARASTFIATPFPPGR